MTDILLYGARQGDPKVSNSSCLYYIALGHQSYQKLRPFAQDTIHLKGSTHKSRMGLGTSTLKIGAIQFAGEKGHQLSWS